MSSTGPKKIVIFGTRETAEVVHFYLEHDSDYEAVAFTVDGEYLEEDTFQGLPVVPFEEISQSHPADDFGMFVAMTYQKVNQARAQKCGEAADKGYQLISYVSSKAYAWPGLSIGRNTFIMEGNTLQPFTRIGDHVLLWSGNHIGHHSTIEDNVYIASQAIISGRVRVGEFSFIGVNATIRDGVTIGKSCVIGAGALVLADTEDFQVFPAVGTEPSRVPSNRLRRI